MRFGHQRIVEEVERLGLEAARACAGTAPGTGPDAPTRNRLGLLAAHGRQLLRVAALTDGAAPHPSEVTAAVRDAVATLLPVLEEAVGVAPSGIGDAPAPRPGGDGWADLSGIERSIAVLVSDGLTNRQVARRVSLSPHTVNYYLRGMFRKLGIASRVELATLARAHRAQEDHATADRAAGGRTPPVGASH